MKKSQLVEMIRAIVADEVRKQLPEIVTETYLRRLVSESSPQPQQRRPTFEEVFQDELEARYEHIPEPMDNTDHGIYHTNDVIRRKNESAGVPHKLLSKDNPFADVYEDVTPIPTGRGMSQQPGPGQMSEEYSPMPVKNNVPLEAFGDFSRFGAITKQLDDKSAGGPMKQTPQAEERRLDQYRKMLEEKVIDTSSE